ncbi:MAG TPA: PAS domain-containing protein [Polyangiaceae bacterium LLY-WYZ-14_1]|nr:PAS domain-containing protein [Polyangiaceae bacterium LLY-WYZ-14_1]
MPEPPDTSRFLERSLDLLCIARDERLVWANDAFLRAVGHRREALLGRPFLDFIHPAEVPASLRVVARLQGGEAIEGFVNRWETASGDHRWFAWNAFLAEDGLIYASARDVTGERRAVRDATRRVQLMEMAEEIVGLGHWRYGIEDRRLHWSPGVFRIHGRPLDAGQPSLDDAIGYYHPDDRSQAADAVAAAVDLGRPFDFRLRIRRADGEVRRVRAQGRREVDTATDEPVAIFGVIQDLTDDERLRRRLDEANRLASIGTLAAGVGHEIRNPLAYVQANADLLREDLDALAQGVAPERPLSELAEMAREIQDGGRRIARIVEALRTFSRSRRPTLQAVDLRAVAEAALRVAATELRRQRVEVDPTGLVPVPAALGDEGQLVQAVVNLLVNAAQAVAETRGTGDAGGSPAAPAPQPPVALRTGVAAVGERPYLEIEDRGIGMGDEVLRQAFHPFYTTKPAGEGTGLGLAITHGLITGMGGTVELRSTPGVGTVARIEVPPSTARSGETTPRPPTS